MLIVAFTMSSVAGYARAAEPEDDKYITVVVQSGDTLWTLAREYGPKDQDVRQTIYEICRLNDIQASDLKAGDQITIKAN